MKCITVCEPYASAIIRGPKRVENRPNPWRYRGRVAIHAGKSQKFMGTLTPAELAQWPAFDPQKLVFGAILGTVEIYACVPYQPQRFTRNPWAFGPWCLLLRDPKPLARPVPYRGQLGLFDVPDEYFQEGR